MAIMVVVPALLYPAIMVLVTQLALFGQRSLQQEPMRVAVVGAAANESPLQSDSSLQVLQAATSWQEQLRAGRLDAVVVLQPRNSGEYETEKVKIFYDAARDRSSAARAVVDDRMREWGDSLLSRRLREQNLPVSFGRPVAISGVSVASPRELGGYALGRFLPMILILMTVLGAFYPAIDLAAGEKERGTLEPLLTTPVPADEIVAGKFAAVTVIALSAATLNLMSILLTFQSGVSPMSQMVEVQFNLPLSSILLILAVLLLLAVLFSSLFLGIAVRSHSFREAQNALTPVYMVSFLPALLPLMPGIVFSPAVAVVPVGGVAMLFRALMTGDAAPLPSVLAVASTVLYAVGALTFAVRSFGREEVLFGAGGGDFDATGWWERVRDWSRGAEGIPRIHSALLLTALVGLLTFYVGVPFQTNWGEAGILLSQWLLIGSPAVLFAALGPYKLRPTLALRRPSGRAISAAILIAMGGLPIGWFLTWLQGFVLQVPDELLAGLQGLLTADGPGRLVWLLFLVAVTPAICEELLFRGVLLQSLSRELPMVRAVLISAVVFGMFHLSFQTAIRFFPTLWIGLLIGYVVWNTQSILAGMLMHVLNNAVAVLLVSFSTADALGREPEWMLIPLGLVLLAAGVRLLPRRPAAARLDAVPAAIRDARSVTAGHL